MGFEPTWSSEWQSDGHTKHPLDPYFCLSDRVRTCGLRVPNSPLYQTELHLVFENSYTLFPKEYFHLQTVTLCGTDETRTRIQSFDTRSDSPVGNLCHHNSVFLSSWWDSNPHRTLCSFLNPNQVGCQLPTQLVFENSFTLFSKEYVSVQLYFVLSHKGSNLDSSAPKTDVLPITP